MWNLARELRVARAIHESHSALSHQRDDFKRAPVDRRLPGALEAEFSPVSGSARGLTS
jgi:hypothetical protein